MKKKAILNIILILAMITAICMPASAAIDSKPPQVISCSPSQNQKSVPVGTEIRIKFNENVIKGAAFAKITLTDSKNKAVAFASAISGINLSIKPKTALTYESEYTLKIPAGALNDKAGNLMKTQLTLKFSTTKAAPKGPVVQEDNKVQEKVDNALTKTYTLSQLQADFKEYQNVIDTYHPKLYTNKEELSQLFKEQYKKISNNMTVMEFYRLLEPIVAKLKCGHSRIYFSKELNDCIAKQGNYLPLSLRIADNKAYVYRSLLSANIPAGSEIVSINGKSMQEILQFLVDNLTTDGDNVTEKYYIINNWFNELYHNFIGGPDSFHIAYKAPGDDKTIETVISAEVQEKVMGAINDLNSSTANNQPYYGTFQRDYAVLTIKSFAFIDDQSLNAFKAFIDDFFAKLKDAKISNLILDVRDNWGGSPYCGSYLLSYLINKDFLYLDKDNPPYYLDLEKPIKPANNNFQGNLYTLTNGASFSTTGHVCALLKYHNIGMFIGEETGGSYICTDSSREATLSNTKIILHYSREAWKVVASGLTPGRGIIPDHIVTPTIQDYLDGKDVVMDFTLNLIKND